MWSWAGAWQEPAPPHQRQKHIWELGQAADVRWSDSWVCSVEGLAPSPGSQPCCMSHATSCLCTRCLLLPYQPPHQTMEQPLQPLTLHSDFWAEKSRSCMVHAGCRWALAPCQAVPCVLRPGPDLEAQALSGLFSWQTDEVRGWQKLLVPLKALPGQVCQPTHFSLVRGWYTAKANPCQQECRLLYKEVSPWVPKCSPPANLCVRSRKFFGRHVRGGVQR